MPSPDRLIVLFRRDQIQREVDRLASQIREDYRDKNPLLIGVLKGSFIFMADLVRALNIPLEVDFVRIGSYGARTESSGEVDEIHGLRTPVLGRHVLVIEDIVDTGTTLSWLMNSLREKKPASLRLCAMFDKPARRKVLVHIDYMGLTLPNRFVVGYGLDFNERYRYLPDLYAIEESRA